MRVVMRDMAPIHTAYNAQRKAHAPRHPLEVEWVDARLLLVYRFAVYVDKTVQHRWTAGATVSVIPRSS